MFKKMLSNKFNNINLKKKLINLFIITIIFPALVIGYFLTNRLYSTTISNIKSLCETSNNQLRGNIINKLNVYMDVTHALLNDIQLQQYLVTNYEDEYEALNDYQMKIYPLINRLSGNDRNIVIRIFTDNKTVRYSGVTNNSIKQLANQSWFNYSDLHNSMFKWTYERAMNRENNNYTLGCYKVAKVSDTNSMVYSVFFSEEVIYSLISEEKAAGNIVFLYDEYGNIISSTERKLVFKNINEIMEEQIEQLKDIKNHSIITYRSKEYMTFKTSINYQPLYIKNWGIVYMLPFSEILSEMNKIWISSLFLCLICIVFSLVILALISENITKRISNLIKKMIKIWETDFSVDIDISGSDEIGMLEAHFKKMVTKVNILIAEVCQANLKIKDAELKNQRIDMEKKQAELIALQGQINPHYLFNTLDTIRMNLILNKDRQTARIIEAFSENFRGCFFSENDMHTVKSELQCIDNYFTIQKYRFGEKINLITLVPENLLDIKIPKLIIQPLVENAVYHGIETKPGKGNIELIIYEDDGKLFIRVLDDGIGIKREQLEKIQDFISNGNSFIENKKTSGIALSNINERLKLIYGNEYGLKLTSSAGVMTSAIITIPLAF